MSLLYSIHVEFNMAIKVLESNNVLWTILCLYKVMFIEYNVLRNFLIFLINFVWQCDKWCQWTCIRPPRGQVRHSKSRRYSPIVTNMVSEQGYISNFKVQSLILPRQIESFSSMVSWNLWARDYRMMELHIFTNLMSCHRT